MVLRHAFETLALHFVEVNVQLDNAPRSRWPSVSGSSRGVLAAGA